MSQRLNEWLKFSHFAFQSQWKWSIGPLLEWRPARHDIVNRIVSKRTARRLLVICVRCDDEFAKKSCTFLTTKSGSVAPPNLPFTQCIPTFSEERMLHMLRSILLASGWTSYHCKYRALLKEFKQTEERLASTPKLHTSMLILPERPRKKDFEKVHIDINAMEYRNTVCQIIEKI